MVSLDSVYQRVKRSLTSDTVVLLIVLSSMRELRVSSSVLKEKGGKE